MSAINAVLAEEMDSVKDMLPPYIIEGCVPITNDAQTLLDVCAKAKKGDVADELRERPHAIHRTRVSGG